MRMIELAGMEPLRPHIVVFGAGGAGGNAIENMMAGGLRGVRFVAANTDAQALRRSSADSVIQLGRKTTGGLGAGSSPAIGREAAEEALPEIKAALEGAHMCFVAAGLGGGTGTGAAPIIAAEARRMGILTVAVVTRPFAFEGRRRAAQADDGLAELEAAADTVIVIPNQNLFRIASAGTTFKEAFETADSVLADGVRGITDLMTTPGLINLDFADVRTVMAGMGRAMLGAGEVSGADRALHAAEAAVSNPLLDEAVKGARGLLISISGGEDLRLMEVDEVASHMKDMVDPDADIIWGSAFRPELEGRIRVSIVATGLGAAAELAPAIPAPPRPKPVAAAPVPVPVPAPPARTRPASPRLPLLTAPAAGIEIPTVEPFAPDAAPPASPASARCRISASASACKWP